MNERLFISLKSKIQNKKLNFLLNDAYFAKIINPQNISNASILHIDYGSQIFAF